MVISVSEFLEKVSKLKRTQEKIDALKANDSLVLRTIMQGAYDPRVKFLLPEGEPPYKPNDLVDQQHVLINDARMIAYFVEGFYPNLPQTKREMMFIELLERVDPNDAKMLCHMKDKKPFKGITKEHVSEAFPGIFDQ
jgi:hypothetical protein